MSETLTAESPESSGAAVDTNNENVSHSGDNNQSSQTNEVSEDNSVPTKQVPENYEFKDPEGQHFDGEVIGAFSDVAKELGLSQEEASKVVEKMAQKLAERQSHNIEAVREEWVESARTDKEYGGDKLGENLAVAKRALDQLGTPELRTLLNESGLGNNPEIIRFMFRAGKALSEDTHVGASQGAGRSKEAPRDFAGYANALYSNQQSR